jgi:hypothetical protein
MALPKPVARQHEVVCLSQAGHHVVLGTAGSGKTTMAILRAAYLSDPGLPGYGRTLLVTFNKTLVNYIRFLASDILGQVTVENYHTFARGYLHSRGSMGPSSILPTSRSSDLIEAAIVEIGKGYHSLSAQSSSSLKRFDGSLATASKLQPIIAPLIVPGERMLGWSDLCGRSCGRFMRNTRSCAGRVATPTM